LLILLIPPLAVNSCCFFGSVHVHRTSDAFFQEDRRRVVNLPTEGPNDSAAPLRSAAAQCRHRIQNADYYPWDYYRQRSRIGVLAQRHSKNIHPTTGPEKAFGDSLREFRRARSFSQEQLALSSSLDRTYVSLIERGIQSPTLRTVFRICEVLEVAPSDVIRRTEALLAGSKRR
jgi:DNA-binding XRE family transcriptional regulator